ncbi:MAG: cellulase family glycosylhydrolase [Fibrobacter sp.]|nr:cellulase family glycosylhydrolase [Fibrobacter sp.]
MVRRNFSYIIMLGLLALGIGLASAQTQLIKPTRVGPVSQYGQLQASKNASGKGRIYGNCAAYSTSGNEVMVKGMSLFWSCAANQQRYWKKDVIAGLVEHQGIQLIRAAMAVDDMGDWADGHYFTKPTFYQAMLDEAVEAAIENDIYVIIDFHSHVAADSVENAKSFFRTQAQKWGSYDNVIFEVFNEPICASGSKGDNAQCDDFGGFIEMPAIKAYADQVVSVIREFSDNLVIVGTPQWDQHPETAIYSPVSDLKNNVAYALHFYAGETLHHDFDGLTSNAELAMNSGLSVFVSEWGTVDYNGRGSVGTAWNPQWQTWMNANKISQANWNAGINTSEGSQYASEYFGADFNPTNNWTYSASGQWVNANVFAGLTAEEYSACTEYVDEDFFIQSSSSSFEEPGEYVVTDFDGNGKALYNYAYAYGSSGFGNTWDGTCNDGEGCYVLVMEAAAQNGTYGGGLLDITGDPKSANADASAVVFNVAVPGLSGCKVLQYSYKGAGHNFKVRLNENDDDTYIKDGFTAKTDWTVATVTVADMEKMYGYGSLGGNEGNVSDIRFEVFGQPSPDYLYIDDVECVLGEPSSSSSGDEPASSSSSFEEYALSPNYDYAYAGGGWTIANPEGEWGTEATVYDQELGDYFWGLKNVNTEEEGGYAGVGMNVSDLSGCRTLSYKYIGIAHNLTFANTPDGADVTAEWSISGSDTWTTHTFNMASLSGIDLDNALDIKWQVSGGENGNLYIKDIQCIKDGNYSSSSSGKENSSSSVQLPEPNAPTTNTELVDDFEDGDYNPLWNSGPYWVETDVIGGGGASMAELSIVKGNNSSHALQMTYSLDVGEYPWGPPYATISTNDFMDLNLSQCSEVRYDYKGAAHSFRVKVSETMNKLLDMGWGFPTFVVGDSSASWQTVTIPVASLRQQWTGSSGNWVDIETVLPYVNGFDWRIDGKDVDDVSSGTLAIDNIRCIGLAETPYYTITFKNGDEDYEVKSWAAGSNVPDPAGVPAKAADAQYTYVFDYWTWYEDEWGYPTRLVVGEATYEAVYTEITNAYTVTFLLDDGETVYGQVEGVEYGTPVLSVAPPDPVKEADSQFTYRFDSWDPAFTGETVVTGDVSYTANFTTSTNLYSIAFVDDDDTPLKGAVEYPYGTPVDQIDVPVVGDKGSLKFAGWEPGLAPVTRSVIYKALYTDKIVITWKDDDGSVLRLDYVDDGDMPYYGEDPAKDTTAEYTYTFDKWTPAVVAATENATYTASYTSVKNKYDVTFVAEHNPDANITVSKEYGEAVASFAPQVDGAVTAEYTYVFDGWMPAITDQTVVTGGTTYTAKYKQNKNQYTVAFVSDDGSTPLSSVTRDYGTEIVSMFPSSDPTKEPTDAKTYEFDRWVIKVSDTEDTELAEGAVLVSDMKLKAVFREFDRKYAVTFVNYDNSPLKSATLYVYNTPVSGIALPDDSILVRPEDDNYTYTFAGWEPELSAVTKEQVYTAKYTRTAKTDTYTITWMPDEGETPLGTETYAEGEIPVFDGTPTKDPTAEFTYTFAGWTPDIVKVTGDATYTAVFTSVKNSYTVTFAGDSGVVGLPEPQTAEYGTNVSSLLPATNPTKPSTAQFSYTFDKWVVVSGSTTSGLPADAVLGGDMTLKAAFHETVRAYTITFLDWDGSELAKDSYDYNTAASVIVPENPTRKNDAQYSYTFAGWSPAVVAVTDSATYKATYTSKALPQPESSSSSKKVEPAETSSSKVATSSSKAQSSSSKAVSSSSNKAASSSSKKAASSSSKKSGKSSSSSKGKSDVLPTVALTNMSVLFSGNNLAVTAPRSSWVRVQVFDMLGNDRGSFRASVQGSHVFSLHYLEQGRYLVRVSNGSSVQNLNVLIR